MKQSRGRGSWAKNINKEELGKRMSKLALDRWSKSGEDERKAVGQFLKKTRGKKKKDN